MIACTKFGVLLTVEEFRRDERVLVHHQFIRFFIIISSTELHATAKFYDGILSCLNYISKIFLQTYLVTGFDYLQDNENVK